jgi:hypothetical protein
MTGSPSGRGAFPSSAVTVAPVRMGAAAVPPVERRGRRPADSIRLTDIGLASSRRGPRGRGVESPRGGLSR